MYNMYAQSFGNPYGSFPQYQQQSQNYGLSVQPFYQAGRYQQQPAFQRNFGYSGYSTYPQYNFSNRNCNTCQLPPAAVPRPKPVQPKPILWKPCEVPPPPPPPIPIAPPAPCGLPCEVPPPPPPPPAPQPCAGGCTNEGTLPPYVSKVEQAIRSSSQPIRGIK